MSRKSGRHFLQLPGPTNVPDRVLRAMNRAVIDHRGPEFQALGLALLENVKWVFGTRHPVFIYPSSATGAWEAALSNTLSPGDTVLAFQQGFFAERWARSAARLGLDVRLEPWDAAVGLDPDRVKEILVADTRREIRAVLVVHNETSTGVTTDLEAVGAAVRGSGHPALLMADTVSSLAATDVQHDAWGVDVTVSGSQKGLMLPPGLSFTAVSPRAMEARETSRLPCAYWDWGDMLESNRDGFFPYTPATTLLYGLAESLEMLREEGLPNVFARHARFAEATRWAVRGWGLEMVARSAGSFSNAVTAVRMPEGHDADAFRAVVLDRFDMSLGTGLGDLKGRVFRIGHLGDINELTLVGTLAGVEMGLALADVPHQGGGVAAAMDHLKETSSAGGGR
ncbi:MAG: aminotransferase class V-fold PLP-dependent enzyme [Gemmatimonadota bacterium]|nr:aminotransferase class V-fold PLP-dependent enzyme [Gemmatimonadota bacterium]